MEKLILAKEINGAPSEFQVFPYGAVDIEGDPAALLDEESMQQIIESFDRRGNDMVIDYEHQTLKDVKAPAAGWIRKLINKGKQGLWAMVEWTEEARQFLKEREYRYFSPVFAVRGNDRKIIQLHNVALTNFPKLNNLRPIIAKLNFEAHFDPAVLAVAKLFGNTEEDLIVYGGRQGVHSYKQIDREAAIHQVAKMFGNTPEDIKKYGEIG